MPDCLVASSSGMVSIMQAAHFVPTDLASSIRHAESYPYARPACSYLFDGGRMLPLPDDAHRDRLPIIASGSNAAPARLFAKFGSDHRIPVTRAVLQGFAVVFAGHFTSYGAIPATLCPHPQIATEVWITWLTPEQLTIMHQSEGVIGCREAHQRYDFVDLEGIELTLDQHAPVNRAGAYLSRRMLAPEGDPIRFAEVATSDGVLEARSHNAALKLVARLLQPTVHYHMFMRQVLSTVGARQALFEKLTPYTLDRSDLLTPSIVDATSAT